MGYLAGHAIRNPEDCSDVASWSEGVVVLLGKVPRKFMAELDVDVRQHCEGKV